jgi:hypothetical protein
MPTVFIGSSSEQLTTAYALKTCLDPFARATVWNDAEFELNESVFGALLKAADDYDFAVFVFDADDVAMIRRSKVHIVRDNVLFELGLFTGRIGSGRAFWISARGTKDSHIPADLAGIIHLSYDKPAKMDSNTPAKIDVDIIRALDKPCEQLRSRIEKLGPRTDRTIEELNKVRILCAASSEYSEPRFAEDIAKIQSNFPSGSVESAHGVSADQFWNYFKSGQRWDIVHLAMFIDPQTGDLIIPPRDASPAPRISVQGVESLIRMSGARLVVIVTCDSLVLATSISRITNTIAGSKSIDVRTTLNWSEVFYSSLAQGCPLSEAFNRGQALADPSLRLLAKKDFRLNLNPVSPFLSHTNQ